MAQLEELMRQDQAAAANNDRLEALREGVRLIRDTKLEITGMEEELKRKRGYLNELTQKRLVDLFDQAQVRSVGLEAEGNMPAYTATLKPYYHANIAAEWPEDRQQQAYDWLEAEGHGDLIKNVIVIELGLKENKKAQEVEALLQRQKVPYTRRRGVPWNTLTAWLKEQIEKYQEEPPLDTLGATVGRVVDLKEVK